MQRNGLDRPTCRPDEQGDERPLVRAHGWYEADIQMRFFTCHIRVSPGMSVRDIVYAVHDELAPPADTEMLVFECDLFSALAKVQVRYTDGLPDLID